MLQMLEPIIAQLLVDGFLRKPVKTAKAFMHLWMLALGGFLGAIGVVYLLMALNAYLALTYTAPEAALLTGGAALILGGISGITFCIIESERKSKAARHASQAAGLTGDSLIAALMAATEGLEEPVANNPRTSVLLASLAGFMAGDKLHPLH